jgi:hypothetical protein
VDEADVGTSELGGGDGAAGEGVPLGVDADEGPEGERPDAGVGGPDEVGGAVDDGADEVGGAVDAGATGPFDVGGAAGARCRGEVADSPGAGRTRK